MNAFQMRDIVSNVYHTPNWKKKVKDMSDGQVQALYFSFLRRNQIFNKPAPVPEAPMVEQIHQMTLFECGMKGSFYERREA